MPTLSFLKPMQPALVDEPPSGNDWQHEIKHDGYRTLLLVENGKARALSRHSRDWTGDFPGICAAAGGLRCSTAIVDGETCVLDDQGRADFGELRRAIHNRGDLVFFAFDLLYLDGEDLRRKGLTERRARLQELIGDAGPTIRFSESYIGDAAAFFRAAAELGLEGIVSKRVGSRYMAGPTSRWLKTKCFEESALILLGTEVKRSGPPAAHLARLEAGKLAYAGKAMIALSADDRKRLADRMQMFACAGPACPELRREPDARWVQPAIVVGVKHLKGTGGLRHATLRTIHER